MQARLRGEPHDPGSKRARLRFSRELFDLGTRLMAVAESSPSTARQRAVDYRDGLMIALLAARPLRRRNFVRLELGRHLVHDQGSWRLQVPGEETKTGRPIALPFPTALAPALERYLAVHRPVLAALRGRWHQPAGTALWLSAHGSPITEMTFYDRIRQLTAAAFGAAVNPHLFRDAAATSLAIQDPAQVRIAAQILGHASFATTERYYNLARSLDAGQAWLATLDQLRTVISRDHPSNRPAGGVGRGRSRERQEKAERGRRGQAGVSQRTRGRPLVRRFAHPSPAPPLKYIARWSDLPRGTGWAC